MILHNCNVQRRCGRNNVIMHRGSLNLPPASMCRPFGRATGAPTVDRSVSERPGSVRRRDRVGTSPAGRRSTDGTPASPRSGADVSRSHRMGRPSTRRHQARLFRLEPQGRAFQSALADADGRRGGEPPADHPTRRSDYRARRKRVSTCSR